MSIKLCKIRLSQEIFRYFDKTNNFLTGATFANFLRIIHVLNHSEQKRYSLYDIIEGCRNVDKKFQEIFYEKYFGFSLKIVFRYIYRYEQSVDVVHDGFLKIFKAIKDFETANENELEAVLMGWMRRIMVNTAIDLLRKREMMPEIGGLPESVWDEPDKSTAADQLLLYKELISEVKKLPPSYRTVFNLFVIDGYSHLEIAAMLDISVGASKSGLFKARNILQKVVNKNYAIPKYAAGK